MIAGKGFWDGKVLFGRIVGLDVIKVTRIIIAGQVGHDRRDTVADRVESPLVIDEEFVIAYLVDTITAESLRPTRMPFLNSIW